MHLMEGNLECLNCFVVVGEWCMEFGDDVNNKNEDHFLKPISYALKFQEKFHDLKLSVLRLHDQL